jgi:hypothetical protein
MSGFNMLATDSHNLRIDRMSNFYCNSFLEVGDNATAFDENLDHVTTQHSAVD